ncbi:Pfam:Nse4 [Seminavis robusta]|uniref:Non-structural maintenance of chromosomes element 4 n=1 Tax=Seminavis robusta TaxID=568900 RepID=A0A9N8D4E6_9STRA|nr:Pfam:Nse4 [Seminavis robusta]|eukprot:Sro2_g001790.1 Pfam:Nse4 (418) ;mRNA; r:246299-247637
MAPKEQAPDEEQEEHDEEEQGTRRTRRRRQNKKLKMGADSGLTEDDRRRLRAEQRSLGKELQTGPMDEDDGGQWVERAREKNNDLFKNVRFTREAVLDAENANSISQHVSSQINNMVTVPRYKPTSLINSLQKKLTAGSAGTSYFDWKTLGEEVGVCFRSLPSCVNFLVGPLENGRVPIKKARAVRKRKSIAEEETLEEQKPEEMSKKAKKNADQLSQAERDLKKMDKILQERSQQAAQENRAKYDEVKATQPELRNAARVELQEKGSEVELVPFLFNPKSFTQTVENMFNYSFLIKKGSASIRMRKPLAPLSESSAPLGLDSAGCFIAPVDERQDHDGTAKQCVLSFTMKDWGRLCEAYELEGCDIPHRKGSKQQKTNFKQHHRRQSSSQEQEEEEEEQAAEEEEEIDEAEEQEEE